MTAQYHQKCLRKYRNAIFTSTGPDILRASDMHPLITWRATVLVTPAITADFKASKFRRNLFTHIYTAFLGHQLTRQ